MTDRPQAVLFDLDGTLVDSRADIAAACNHALTKHGRAALAVETIRGFVGDGARMLLARAFERPVTDDVVDRALADFRDYYDAHPTEHTSILPGVHALIAHLAPIPLGVVTNKPRATAELVLVRLGLRRHFAEVRGGGDGPLKPDPTLTRDVLRAIGAPPERAWFVGDGPQDIGAGRAAGCFTIAVRGMAAEEALLAAKPDRLVSSLDELTRDVQPGP